MLLFPPFPLHPYTPFCLKLCFKKSGFYASDHIWQCAIWYFYNCLCYTQSGNDKMFLICTRQNRQKLPNKRKIDIIKCKSVGKSEVCLMFDCCMTVKEGALFPCCNKQHSFFFFY